VEGGEGSREESRKGNRIEEERSEGKGRGD
jgi:hypothetical protein